MNAGKSHFRVFKIIYWVTTIIIAIIFFITGVGNLIPFEHITQDMSHLGYPAYFLKILGIWKILGALTIAFPVSPRYKEWAYVGMMLDLSGAAFSRFFSEDGFIMTIVPLAISGLVLISWILQPKETVVSK
jgi:uncharacterized membrane protein YphA (DoxX/SURF4 family)